MSRPPDQPPLLYLAGPDVFVPDPAARGAALKALCAAAGAVGLFPLDGDPVNMVHEPGAIRDANMAMIRRCDALVANMTPFRGPSMDPGTAYEMGAAAALGRLVVGYTVDPRPYAERVAAAMPVLLAADGALRDGDGMAVEQFAMPMADNLMMACGVARLFDNAADAIGFAAARLRAGR